MVHLDAGLTADLPPFVSVIPVRTPTLAPATHTNAWVLGQGDLTVFDPASPWEDEQARLLWALRARIAAGERVERLVLTHHHDDHVGGAEALRQGLGDVPVAAHRITAELVGKRIRVDEILEDDDVLRCGGVELRAVFTPGHAPGHLVFVDSKTGVTVAGDMVAGVGTILISPEDGDLGQYLDSLDRMRVVGAKVLLPAHGPALHQGGAVLAFYVAHRHQRTEQIRQALDRLGRATPLELAPTVYPELPKETHKFAAAQILSHLRWMAKQGLVRDASDGTYEIA